MEILTTKICAVCGAEYQPTGNMQRYCSQMCRWKHQDRLRYQKIVDDTAPCIYRYGVICSEHNCEACGWNPVVEKRRKDEINAHRSD